MKPRPVLIEWGDAADIAPGTWLALDELDDADVSPCDVVSVGWLVSKSKSSLVLALSITQFSDVRGTFVVPRSCVKKITRLKP